jgi:pilus assembly protein CpaB
VEKGQARARNFEAVNQDANDTNSFWLSSRRFGNHGQGATRLSRLRGLVLGFGSLIVLLCVGIVVLVRDMNNLKQSVEANAEQELIRARIAAEAAAASAVQAAKLSMEAQRKAEVKLLVPKSRIEAGTRLEESMFTTMDVKVDHFPEKMLKSTDVQLLAGKYAKSMLSSYSPVSLDDLAANNRSIGVPFFIPAGFRAVSIAVDGRAAVEGFAKPGTLVDVLWFYRSPQAGDTVTTLVPAAKVLSVSGAIEPTAGTMPGSESATVSLLVSAKDAKIVELARNLGALSLSLVGSEENASDAREDGGIKAVTLRDIFRKAPQNQQAVVDGVMETRDPRTGNRMKFVLSDQRWKPEEAAAKPQPKAPAAADSAKQNEVLNLIASRDKDEPRAAEPAKQ